MSMSPSKPRSSRFLRTNAGASAHRRLETAEHLFVKARIAKAIKGTEWEVSTEQMARPQTEAWVRGCDGQSRGPTALPSRCSGSAQSKTRQRGGKSSTAAAGFAGCGSSGIRVRFRCRRTSHLSMLRFS